MPTPLPLRRGFLQGLLGLGGASAAAAAATPPSRPAAAGSDHRFLPAYARAQGHRSLKQSSHDRTGGNADSWPIAAGATREVFAATGPGVITHIWFTIAAPGVFHLRSWSCASTGRARRDPASRRRWATSSASTWDSTWSTNPGS